MRMFVLIALVLICSGCTERARQKNYWVGGDPAVATQQDVVDLKQEVTELRRVINERFDRLEKK